MKVKTFCNNEEYKPKLIISLTSYPLRIGNVHKTIQSLLKQTKKPDKIILWLAKEQFQNEEDFPEELKNLIGNEFELCWCDDLKPHKKYYYTMMEYPNDCVITVDDDYCYPIDLVEKLYRSYMKFPGAISATHARIIEWDKNGNLKQYEDWVYADNEYIGIPVMDLLPIGAWGILYPPHCLNKEVFNKEYIRNHCLYTDDLWLKIMHALEGTPTVLVSGYSFREAIDGTQENTLWEKNVIGQNDLVMHRLLQDYNNFRRDGISLTEILRGKFGPSLGEKRAAKVEWEKNKIREQLQKWKKVIVYGAGNYASKTIKFLNSIEGLEIICVAVTDKRDNPSLFENYEVCEINQIKGHAQHSMVIIAVSEKFHSHVINTIKENGFDNYLLITNSLLNIMKA
jgi:hypothetical protein